MSAPSFPFLLYDFVPTSYYHCRKFLLWIYGEFLTGQILVATSSVTRVCGNIWILVCRFLLDPKLGPWLRWNHMDLVERYLHLGIGFRCLLVLIGTPAEKFYSEFYSSSCVLTFLVGSEARIIDITPPCFQPSARFPSNIKHCHSGY